MTNEEILKVVKATFDSSANGMAAHQDPTEFISLMVDQTMVLQSLRVEDGIQTSLGLDSLVFGEPMFVLDVEGQEPGDGDIIVPTHQQNKLIPVEVVGAVDLTFTNLRRNIMKGRLNEYLDQQLSIRGGKDSVLIAFNGDTDLPATTRTNKALRTTDGFYKRALADANVHDVAFNKVTEKPSTIFGRLLRALPKDYADQIDLLGFYVSTDLYLAYAEEIGARQTTAGDMVLFGQSKPRPLYYMGIPIYPVYGASTDYVMLTVRSNLAIGYGFQMTIGRDVSNRKGKIQITVRMAISANYVLGDAIVFGQHSV